MSLHSPGLPPTFNILNPVYSVLGYRSVPLHPGCSYEKITMHSPGLLSVRYLLGSLHASLKLTACGIGPETHILEKDVGAQTHS